MGRAKGFNLNQLGFSVIEMVIASGIGMVILSATTQILMEQLKLARSVSQKMESSNLLSEIRETLGTPTTCLKTLAALDPNANNEVRQILRDSATGPEVLYETGSTYADNLLKLESIHYGNPQYPIPDTGTGRTKMVLNFEKTGAGTGPKYLARSLTIFVRRDHGAVVSCSAVSDVSNSGGFDPTSFMEHTFIERYNCVAPRNGLCQQETPSDKNFVFCALVRVRSGGNDGGSTDECAVHRMTTGRWQVSGRRGDDPAIVCAMECLGLLTDPVPSTTTASATSATTGFRAPASTQ